MPREKLRYCLIDVSITMMLFFVAYLIQVGLEKSGLVNVVQLVNDFTQLLHTRSLRPDPPQICSTE